MKRLKLEDFVTKNLKKGTAPSVDQLLGQVLGDCHDEEYNHSGIDAHIRKKPGGSNL